MNITTLIYEAISKVSNDKKIETIIKLIYNEYTKEVKAHLNNPESTLYNKYPNIPKNINEFKQNIEFMGKDFEGNNVEYLFWGSRKLHKRIFTVTINPLRVTWDDQYERAFRHGTLDQFMRTELGA